MLVAVEQTSGTAAGGTSSHEAQQPTGAAAAPPADVTVETDQPLADTGEGPQADAAADADRRPSFSARGRARRRARYLRKARELAYRDLGGLVFNLHRFGQRNDPLVMAKLTALEHLDGELRALEDSLAERRPITVLREAGINACPRCAAIHSSEDRFCPNCGLDLAPRAEPPARQRTTGAGESGASATAASATAAEPAQPATAPSADRPAGVEPRGPGDPAGAPGAAGAAKDEAQHDDEKTIVVRPSSSPPRS